MLRTKLFTAIILGIGLICVNAEGATTVIKTFLPAVGGGTSTSTYSTGQDVTVTVDNTVEKVQIYAGTTSEALGKIFITGDGPQNVWIYIVRPGGDTTPANDFYSQQHAAGGNWAGFQDLRGLINLRAVISGNVTGTILIEDVDDRSSGLENFSTPGIVQANVYSGTAGSFHLLAGSTTSNADLVSEEGINQIIINNGNLLGDVRAVGGHIGTIDVTNGDVGASGQPVAIEAADESGNLHIKRINGVKNIYANIDCDTSTTAADGVIETFIAGHPNTQTTLGDFHGSLKLGSFTEQVTIIRDLYADITHGGNLVAGPPSSGLQTITIGRGAKLFSVLRR